MIGEIDDHRAFEIVLFLLLAGPKSRRPQHGHLFTFLTSCGVFLPIHALQLYTLKASSYKERGNTKDWPSRAHSIVMQDKGKGAGERREGGEEGEEMAWGRGRAHDRGRVELTRVSLGISGAG